VGAVLGKGGATINQLRRDSGAGVRLVPLDPDQERYLPRDIAAAGSSGAAHKVVQIEGPITAIMKALRALCGLLRGCQVCGTCSDGSALCGPAQCLFHVSCVSKGRKPAKVYHQQLIFYHSIGWGLCVARTAIAHGVVMIASAHGGG
jgi:hypothetical protein